MSSKFKIRFFTVFSIIFLCIGLTIKEIQNDTFYIIKLGGDILNNGIDFVDHYCWITNLSYTYPHWLYDVFINIIYTNFSCFGVYVSSIISYIVLILSIYIINLKFNKNELLATFVSFVSLATLLCFITARSQVISSIMFLWEVYFIECLIEEGKKRYIIYLSVISLLVANIHATIWPFYFILFLPFIGEEVIYKLSNYFRNSNPNNVKDGKLIINEVKNFKLLICGLLLGFFMGFLSPSRICFTYVFKVMMGSSQDYITEHAPMILINNIPFLIIFCVLLLLLIFSNTKLKLRELFMIFGLVLMSLSSCRHVAFFYIIGFLYFSAIANRYLVDNDDKTLDILAKLFISNKFIYLCSVFFVFLFSLYRLNINLNKPYVPDRLYPVHAVDYIKNNINIEDLKLYNDYNIGSYLLFYDIPIFIDSRCDLYLSEFNGLNYSIFDDAMRMPYNYEERFKFYGVSHVLIFKKDILYRFLIKDSNYNLIYKDKYFVLFEKL